MDWYSPIINRWIQWYKTSYDRYETERCEWKQWTLSTQYSLQFKVYSSIFPLRSGKKSKFKLGDLVRISKYKHLFEKGYTPNWTVEVFKVQRIQSTNPPTYFLVDMNGNDIRGAFYAEELRKTEYPKLYLVERILKRKGKQLYIKWLGFDSSHNSWINENEMI